MRFRKITEDLLRKAIAENFSLRATLQSLDIAASGGNYQSLKKAIALFKIDTKHFTGQGHLKGKTHSYATRPLEEVLVKGKHENTWRLKSRLIQAELKEHQCENCKLSHWLEIPIPLELHHVDGDRTNNELSNLELLCPNCHAMTDNYRGKNIKV